MKTQYEIQPCVIDENDWYWHKYPYNHVESCNCIFYVPEQMGGDETNRPTYCAIHGYDFPIEGCNYRKTIREVLDETDFNRRRETQEGHS